MVLWVFWDLRTMDTPIVLPTSMFILGFSAALTIIDFRDSFREGAPATAPVSPRTQKRITSAMLLITFTLAVILAIMLIQK